MIAMIPLKALAVSVAGLGLLAAVVNTPSAAADPGQNCTPPVWVTMYGVPYASRITCYNPDGSYQVCTSMGTQANGPGTCINYPAPPAPAPGNLLPINPPVPGVPPPPPPAP